MHWTQLVVASLIASFGSQLAACTAAPDAANANEASSTAAATSETTGDTGEESGAASSCEDPVPLLQAGTQTPSGIERCADGSLRRVEVVDCVDPLPGGPSCAEPPDEMDLHQCDADADCGDPLARCVQVSHAMFGNYCQCHRGCERDDDCASLPEGGQRVCVCPIDGLSTAASCVQAGCTDATSCEGHDCLGTGFDPTARCNPPNRFACATSQDECRADADCDPGETCAPGATLAPGHSCALLECAP